MSEGNPKGGDDTEAEKKSSWFTEAQLENIPGWTELNPGQRALAVKNFEQVSLGLAIEEGQTKATKASVDSNLLKRAWLGMTHSYQIRKGQSEAYKEMVLDSTKNAELLGQIVTGMMASKIDAAVGENGNIEVLFAENLKGVVDSAEYRNEIEKLNSSASKFSEVPYEWGLESATNSQREKYKKAQDGYYQSLSITKEALKGTWNPELININLDSINEKVQTQQFINNHPELEKELRSIKSPKFWLTVAEKGGYFALGFVNKSLFAAALGVVATPIASGFLAGVIGRERAHDKIRAAQIDSRRGKRENNELVDKLTKAQDFGNGISRLTGKAMWAIDTANKDTEALAASVKYAHSLLEKGLLDFGSKENRVANQYKFMQALSIAQALITMREISSTETEDKSGKMFASTDKRLAKLGKQRFSYLNKETAKSIATGVGFALVGQAARWFWPHVDPEIGTEDVTEHKLGNSAMSHPTPIETFKGEGEPFSGVPGWSPSVEQLSKVGSHEDAVNLDHPAPLASRPLVTPATPATAAETINTITDYKLGKEVDGVHFETIKEGGSAWEALRKLTEENNLPRSIWSDPRSIVTLPNGSQTHISNLDLTHPGDKIMHVAGTGPDDPGYVRFVPASGLEHGLGEDLPYNNPPIEESTTETNPVNPFGNESNYSITFEAGDPVDGAKHISENLSLSESQWSEALSNSIFTVDNKEVSLEELEGCGVLRQGDQIEWVKNVELDEPARFIVLRDGVRIDDFTTPTGATPQEAPLELHVPEVEKDSPHIQETAEIHLANPADSTPERQPETLSTSYRQGIDVLSEEMRSWNSELSLPPSYRDKLIERLANEIRNGEIKLPANGYVIYVDSGNSIVGNTASILHYDSTTHSLNYIGTDKVSVGSPERWGGGSHYS